MNKLTSIRLTGLLTIVLFITCLFSCNNNNESANIKTSFSADSAKINELYLRYRHTINTNYDSSRVLLNNIYDTLTLLSPEKQKLSIQFISFISVSEVIVGNFNAADSLTSLAISLAYKIGDEDYYDVAHQNRGIYYWYIDKIDSAMYHLEKASKLAKKTNDIDQLIAAKANLAALSQEQKEYEKSVKEFEEVIVLCKMHEKWQYLADNLNNLGILYDQTGQLFSAINCYQKSIDMYEKINSNHNYLGPINNIALVYGKLGMDSLALSCYNELSKNAKEGKNHESYCLALINISTIYIKNHESDKALKTINNVLEYFQANKMKPSHIQANCFINMAKIYRDKKELNKSKSYLRKAIRLSDSTINNSDFVVASSLLTDIYYDEFYCDSINYYGIRALDTAIRYNMIDEVIKLSNNLAKMNRTNNNIKKAFHYYQIYEKNCRAYLDTLSTQKTKDLAYYYELRKHESEKRLLKKENKQNKKEIKTSESIIKEQRLILAHIIILLVLLILTVFFISYQSRKKARLNKLLNDENDFKNNLFSIVSHDLRGPIISLYQVFNLLTKKKIDAQKREIVENELLAKLEKTIDLTDNLLFWTSEQLKGQNYQLETFNVKELVDKIFGNLTEIRDTSTITFDNAISAKVEIYADKNIIHMVLRNFLSNAYKYTPDNGKIIVSSELKEKEIVFSVEDTGSGISPIDYDKILSNKGIFSCKGLHGEQGKGFGLLLCKYFLEKQGGNIWFTSELNKGSVFYFSIPKQAKKKLSS